MFNQTKRKSPCNPEFKAMDPAGEEVKEEKKDCWYTSSVMARKNKIRNRMKNNPKQGAYLGSSTGSCSL